MWKEHVKILLVYYYDWIVEISPLFFAEINAVEQMESL